MRYMCPVCGWPDLEHPPSEPLHEICSSCGIQFGLNALAATGDPRHAAAIERWRDRWIAEDMPFFGRQPPAGWNPAMQLRNIGIEL